MENGASKSIFLRPKLNIPRKSASWLGAIRLTSLISSREKPLRFQSIWKAENIMGVGIDLDYVEQNSVGSTVMSIARNTAVVIENKW